MGKLAAYGFGLTLALAPADLPARAAAVAGSQPAAAAFYDAYLKLRPSGVPGAKQRTRLRPLVSAALAALLTQAAHCLLTCKQGSALKSWGDHLVHRVGRKKAVPAIARKLSVILHAVWRSGEPFRAASTQAAA